MQDTQREVMHVKVAECFDRLKDMLEQLEVPGCGSALQTIAGKIALARNGNQTVTSRANEGWGRKRRPQQSFMEFEEE